MTQDWVILVLVGTLLLWALRSLAPLVRATARVRSALAAAQRRLGADPDPVAFADAHAEAFTAMQSDKLLGPSWQVFEHGLIVPDDRPGQIIQSTTEIGRSFDATILLRRAGVDPRYQAAVPGLLVGAGLLVTFLGLAAALSKAGMVVAEGVDQTQRNAALRDLLGAASVKFITSVTGLFLSICYAVLHKRCLRSVERALASFAAAVQQRMPHVTPARLQAEANRQIERQQRTIEQISTDLIVNLGSAMERAFGAGLEQHIGPLSRAVEQLATRMGADNENAMQQMLQRFLERLEGAVGDSMKGTATTIAALGDKLSVLQGALDEAARKMTQAATDMGKGLGEGADKALAGVSTTVAEIVTMLRALAEEQRQAGGAAVADLRTAMAEAAKAMEVAAGRIGGALDGGAADAGKRLVAATEAMRNDLQALVKQLGDTVVQGGKDFTASASASGAQIKGAGESLVRDVAAIGQKLLGDAEQAGRALRSGGEEAGAQLAAAGRVVAQGGEGLGARLDGLGQAAARLATQAAGLEQSLGAATAPLGQTAADLRVVAETARQALAPWRETADALRGASEGLRGTATGLADTLRLIGELSQRVTQAADRFGGVDATMAQTVEKLKDGVIDYQREIADFVTKMDQGLAKSVNGLGAFGKAIEDALEEIADLQKRKAA